MLTWILTNWGTILVSLGVLFLLVLALRSVRKDQKQGGCPGGCAGCSHAACGHACDVNHKK